MAIRDRRPAGANADYDRYRRKSNQEWDMAGLARQDGDAKAAEKHTAAAREYDRLAREALA